MSIIPGIFYKEQEKNKTYFILRSSLNHRHLCKLFRDTLLNSIIHTFFHSLQGIQMWSEVAPSATTTGKAARGDNNKNNNCGQTTTANECTRLRSAAVHFIMLCAWAHEH